VQVWNTKGVCLSNTKGHTGAVKAVCWLSEDDTELNYLSASHDQSIIKWRLGKEKNQLVNMEKFVGHTESVECIDVNKEKKKVS
jgi:WD40 repeat protein